MADKSGLTKAGNLTRSNIKPRADLFEAVIGMLYIYLRSGDKEDIALDTITNVLDYVEDGPWSNWSTSDLETSRTRKCIYMEIAMKQKKRKLVMNGPLVIWDLYYV
jgi:hypothetical protein